MNTNGRKRLGYTLIELMVTVAVVSILAAAATQEVRVYVAKSKRTEGVYILAKLWELQEEYKGKTGHYTENFDYLGLQAADRISPTIIKGKYYTFQLSQPWGEDSYYCSATANIDGDLWPDVLVIAEGADGDGS